MRSGGSPFAERPLRLVEQKANLRVGIFFNRIFFNIY